jgi:hypothetical protein
MKLITSTTFTLSQLVAMLSTLENNMYAQPITISNGSSIGMHVRHILELYQCLLRDYEAGVINYDNRARNQLIETNSTYAITVIEDILEGLKDLPCDKTLCIVENQSEHEAFDLVQSTLNRELLYNLEHCIHHMAIIAICVRAEFPQIELSPNFGKAYSTIRYEKSKVCVQ